MARVAAVYSPRLKEAFVFKFRACFGVIAELVALFMEALTHEFNRPATIGFLPVEPEDFSDDSEPPSTRQDRQRFVFVVFVDVVAVEVFSGDIASATCHATDAFFERIQPRKVACAIAFDLTGDLS